LIEYCEKHIHGIINITVLASWIKKFL
jgi:transposase InsO family protein